MPEEIVNIEDLLLEEEETETSKEEIVSVDDLDFGSGKTNDSSTETQTMESNVMDSGSGDGLLDLPEINHVTTEQLQDHRFGFAEKDMATKLDEIYGGPNGKFEITEEDIGQDTIKIKNKSNGKTQEFSVTGGGPRGYASLQADIQSFIESSSQEDEIQTEDYKKRKNVRNLTGGSISTDDNINYIDLSQSSMPNTDRQKFADRKGTFGDFDLSNIGGYNPEQTETNTEKLEEITSDISSLFQQKLRAERKNQAGTKDGKKAGQTFKIPEATKEQIIQSVFEDLNKTGDYLLPMGQYKKIIGGTDGMFFEQEKRKFANTYNASNRITNSKAGELDPEIKNAVLDGVYAKLDDSWKGKADYVALRKPFEDTLSDINTKLETETDPEVVKQLLNSKKSAQDSINSINQDIDDYAKDQDYLWDYKTKDLASKWAADGYSEYRANAMAEAFDQARGGGLDDELASIKKTNPNLNDRQALDLYLNKLIIAEQDILRGGKKDIVNINLSKLGSDTKKIDKDFINKLKQSGNYSETLDGEIGDVEISVADLMGMGFDARDFRGWFDKWQTKEAISEEHLKMLDTYEEARDHNHSITRAVYELTHLDRNPDSIVSGTGSVEGAGMNTLAFVSTLMEKGQTAVRTQWFDASNREANQSIASMRTEGTSREYTDRAMLDNMNIAAREFNEDNAEKIEKGEVSAIVWTDDQLKSINRTFGDHVAEGVGEFVPTLIELAAITVASEGALTVTGAGMYLARLKKAGDVYSKMKYHAAMLGLEEIKMQTAGFKAGSGAAFYGFGALTPWFRPGALPMGIGTTAKGLDPLWQKTFGAGITGAFAGETAQITELGWEHLKGEQDFKSEMKHLFGDFDEVQQRMVTNAAVFGIAHNMGKGRIKRQDLAITTQQKFKLKTKIDKKMEDLLYEKKDLKEVQKLRKEKEQNEKDWRDGKKTKEEYEKENDSVNNALELYKEVGLREYKDLSNMEKSRYDTYDRAWNDVQNLFNAQAFAKELDPHGGYSKEAYTKLDKSAQDKITESFKKNYQQRVIDPINELMRRANKGHKDLVVEFTNNRAEFEHDANGRDLGNVAEYDKIKNTILFDKSKFTIGTSNHELVHMALRQVFKGNERMEVNFTKKIDRVFEDAFGKKLNDFLREGVAREYKVEIEGMNKKLRDRYDKGEISKAEFEKGLKENEKKRQKEELDLQQEEFLSNLAEVITNPDIYYSKINNTFMKNAKQEIYQFLEESIPGMGKYFKPKTAHGFIDFLGRLGDSGRKGRSIKGKILNLSKLEDVSFLGIEYKETIKEGKMASRDLYKEKELIKQDNLVLGKTKLKDTGKKFPKTIVIDGKKQPHPRAGQPMTWRDVMTSNVTEIKDLNKLIEKAEKTQEIINKLEPLHEMSKSKDYGDRNPEVVEGRRSILVGQLRENNMGYLSDFIDGPYGYKNVQGSEVTRDMFSRYVKNTEFNKFIDTYFKRAEKYKDVPFGAYLRDNIDFRQGNILKALGASKEAQAKRVKTQSLNQMIEAGWDIADKGGGDAGGRTNAPKDGKVGIEIVNKLPVTQSHIKTIEKIAETIETKDLDYKTLLDQAPEATKKMFGKTTQAKANFIANHWQTLYDLLPKNLTETTGTATGIENSLMTRKMPDGTMKNVFYKGLGETVKMTDTGAKTGTELQPKIKMGKKEFLAELGIKDNRTQEKISSKTGDVDISGMNVKVDRGITTSVLPSLINQTGKAITNQVTRFAPELKNRPDLQGLNVLENFRNQLASGKSDKLAGKDISKELVDKFTEDYISGRIDNSKGLNIHTAAWILEDKRYDKFAEKQKQQLVNFIDKVKDLYDPPAKEKLFKDKLEEGILTEIRRQEGFYGKRPEVVEAKTMSRVIDYFEKEFGIKVEDKAVKDYGSNRKDIANDIKYSNKFINKFAKDNPKILRLLTTDMGSGNTIEYGKRRNKTNIKEILLSKGIEPTASAVDKYFFKRYGMNFKGSKTDYGTSLNAIRIADPGKVKDAATLFLLKNSVGKKLRGKELDVAMHDVYLKEVTSLAKDPVTGQRYTYKQTLDANKKLREIYFENIREVLLEAKAEGKMQEAFTWFLRHSQRQTNIGKGINKGTFSIMFGSTILGEKSVMKTTTGSKDIYFHSEHNMQLLNNTMNFGKLVLETSPKKGATPEQLEKAKKEYKKRFELLDREAHQAIVPKEWTKIYDSKEYEGPAKLDPRFANKDLGEISSIINFLIKPGSTLDMLYLPGKRGETIGEYLLGKYSDFQVKEILKLAKAPEALPLQKLGVLSRMKMKSKGAATPEQLKKAKITDTAIVEGRKRNKKARGMSTFDFDETVGISDNFVIAKKGKETKRIASDKWPFVGEKMIKEGWKMDFSDFNKVTGGKPGPLMQKMKNQIKKFGPDNVFILTARAKESAPAIHEYLKSEGIEIPLENITGLGNSTGEAKAMWMLEKFSQGYNDMYFVDDAMPNVKAVKEVLDQLDIKSKVQQALASKNLFKDINKIMEHSLDIGSKKVFSKAEAKVRGKDIKRRRVFMRDSAADLELLIEPLYGKGKEGIKNKKWFNKEFVMPFERGTRDYNTARQSAKNDYMNLRKQNKDVVKEISKSVEGTAFTNDMAMRVYLWNKAGYKIPDLAKGTEAKLVEHIQSNPRLQAYAENFARITKQEKGLKEPGENWWGETMAGEVTNINRGVSRKQYLQEWIDVKNEIFTEENLNKMESKLGTEWRENIEDMFDRMETGRTRSLKMDRGSAAMMNYLNGGIGTIMNFNTRSAVLQTISTTNFLNMRENNPIAAAKAMGNVKQFAKDFRYIMNSDMLRQRRDGLAMNVTEAEIASAAASSQNPVQSIISKVLKAGYLPTKMADSFAISFGGATFYRNRIKMYEKQGMKTKEAESKAFLDFQVIAERTQQSSRADLLSKQQTSLIGRFILPFANTPMQMNRAGMKDILDISKGRFKGGRELSEKIGRISYYMGAQVAIFAGLQSALFAMLLNDDDVTDEKLANTKSMMLNTTVDSMLRGFGIQGSVLSAAKNAIQEFIKQDSKPGFTADYSEVAEKLLNVSPPIGSKFGMLDRAGDRKKWAKIKKNDEFKFELGNPSLEASLMTVQAVTNAPVYSPYQNLFNMQHALNDQYETWQRTLMAAGWTPYSVAIETEDKKKKNIKTKNFKNKTFNKTFDKKTFKRKTFN